MAKKNIDPIETMKMEMYKKSGVPEERAKMLIANTVPMSGLKGSGIGNGVTSAMVRKHNEIVQKSNKVKKSK